MTEHSCLGPPPSARRPADGGVSQFRDVMSLWPSGVAVVTVVDASGRPHGMTCNSLCSVSLSPPCMLVSLYRATSTVTAIRDSAAFCVNLLASGSKAISQMFAAAKPDRFEGVDWRLSSEVRCPCLTGPASYALLECELQSVSYVHDHALIVGDVRAIDWRSTDSMLYHDREYRPATNQAVG